jgi:hypothetical protein
VLPNAALKIGGYTDIHGSCVIRHDVHIRGHAMRPLSAIAFTHGAFWCLGFLPSLLKLWCHRHEIQ